MKKIERALISVSDKRGIAELAHQLHARGVEILSTGGTARVLEEEGVSVTSIDAFTGFPEMLDGRVKTLHPKVHAGLLSLRDNPAHQETMRAHELGYIDLVVVNLYPFEKTLSRTDATHEEMIENIDIGGPSMVRSAAKNYRDVTVITDPDDYRRLCDEMDAHDGAVSVQFNAQCAQKAYAMTAYYDALIAEYLASHTGANLSSYPATYVQGYRKVQDLRYGENPHQSAAFYRTARHDEPCVPCAQQLHGKELSYNNYLDLDAALELVKEFSVPTAIVVKHTNPCGAASAEDICTAYTTARATDALSAFGSVCAFNRCMDKELADEVTSTFVEAVIAPEYTEEALAQLMTKKNLRVLRLPSLEAWCTEKMQLCGGHAVRSVTGGLLVQERDTALLGSEGVQCVTTREPTEEEMKALLFAWRCVKHVKSNAIVYARGSELVGVGAGQMSRVDSAKIAALKAQKDVAGSVMASDAFFPFRDGIDAAAEAGVTAIIQPGGSVKDSEVIDAANEHGIAMVFTGMRHFRH